MIDSFGLYLAYAAINTTIMTIDQRELDDLTRTKLRQFIIKTFETVDPNAKYQRNWHIDLICEYLEACSRGEIKRLIINLPPRHLKSICTSVAFVAWLLGRNPSKQIMCASYSQELAFKHSLDCRLVIESPWYQRLFPDTKLVSDQNTKRKFVTTARGHRIATSVGGTVTGEGADILIVDDPISAKNQFSPTFRATANMWFDQVFTTRLNDKKEGCIIVIMQRLHEGDLTGHLLAKEGGWTHLRVPLIAEEDEVIDFGSVHIERKVGDLLQPSRMGEVEVAREKNALGPYGFSSQYQQSPSPEGGGAFRLEWLQYYEPKGHAGMNVYIFVDPADSKRKASDYTAVMVVGANKDGNLYVLEMVRDRLNLKEREDLVFNLHAKYKPKAFYYQKYFMESDIQHMQLVMNERNYRFSIQPLTIKLPKEDRICRLIPLFADGRIYLPRYEWKVNTEGKSVDVVNQFINEEYLLFNAANHDDMLDALSMLCFVNIQYANSSVVNYEQLYSDIQW